MKILRRLMIFYEIKFVLHPILFYFIGFGNPSWKSWLATTTSSMSRHRMIDPSLMHSM
jgi:hypothetical protein